MKIRQVFSPIVWEFYQTTSIVIVKQVLTRVLLAMTVIFCLTISELNAETFSVSLAFERQSLDLDSGTVFDDFMGDGAGVDIRIAFNALRSPGALLTLADTEGVVLSYLEGATFDSISSESETVVNLIFSADVVAVPFKAGDTILIRTDSGAVYKLGNAFESETGVTFDYSEL